MKNDTDILNGTVRVLLIEDPRGNSAGIQKYLKKIEEPSFELAVAGTIPEALQILGRSNIDIILLDLTPDTQGLETFRQIHKAAALPIIVLTGVEEFGLNTIREGAQGYLVKKEIDERMLKRTMLQTLERYRLTSQLEMALTEESLRDPLTGLLNRRALQRILKYEVEKAKRYKVGGYLYLIDLDGFKAVNDKYGYATGDALLKAVGQRLRSKLRATDHVVRLGGDEFVVISRNDRVAEARLVTDKIRLLVKEAEVPAGARREKINISACLGVLNLLDCDSPFDQVLEKAHLALQRSKSFGKNFAILYGPEGELKPPPLEDWKQILDTFSHDPGLRSQVFIQPIARLHDRICVGYEMLNRFLIEGLESPDDFFRAAREANTMVTADLGCLKNSLLAASGLPRDLVIHVNLFPSTLISLGGGDLWKYFEKSGKRRYCVGLSEQEILEDISELAAVCQIFKQAGVQIALDDVGLGMSWLEPMLLLEPEIIKIDRRYIRGVGRNPVQQRLLKKLLRVVHSCDAVALAKGVDEEGDYKLLKDFGVELGQGAFLGKPERIQTNQAKT